MKQALLRLRARAGIALIAVCMVAGPLAAVGAYHSTFIYSEGWEALNVPWPAIGAAFWLATAIAIFRLMGILRRTRNSVQRAAGRARRSRFPGSFLESRVVVVATILLAGAFLSFRTQGTVATVVHSMAESRSAAREFSTTPGISSSRRSCPMVAVEMKEFGRLRLCAPHDLVDRLNYKSLSGYVKGDLSWVGLTIDEVHWSDLER